MDHISKNLPNVKKASQSLMPSWPKPTAERMAKASWAVKQIMKGRPEIGAENREYIVGLTETISYLSDEEIGWLTDPREGLATRCRYLPTPADVYDLIRERTARRDQFKTKTNPMPERWTHAIEERTRKQIVAEALGYDPDDRHKRPQRPPPVTPTDDDLAALPARLKQAYKPPTPEFMEYLEDSGYWAWLDDIR